MSQMNMQSTHSSICPRRKLVRNRARQEGRAKLMADTPCNHSADGGTVCSWTGGVADAVYGFWMCGFFGKAPMLPPVPSAD